MLFPDYDLGVTENLVAQLVAALYDIYDLALLLFAGREFRHGFVQVGVEIVTLGLDLGYTLLAQSLGELLATSFSPSRRAAMSSLFSEASTARSTSSST